MRIFVDGSNRGNPGIGGVGCVFYSDDGKEIDTYQKFIGDNITNNYAEYAAIIEAIKRLMIINKDKESCIIFSDSKVICNQINNGWKINYKHLDTLNKEVKMLIDKAGFDIIIEEIRRDDNKVANDLAQDITARKKKELMNGSRSWKRIGE